MDWIESTACALCDKAFGVFTPRKHWCVLCVVFVYVCAAALTTASQSRVLAVRVRQVCTGPSPGAAALAYPQTRVSTLCARTHTRSALQRCVSARFSCRAALQSDHMSALLALHIRAGESGPSLPRLRAGGASSVREFGARVVHGGQGRHIADAAAAIAPAPGRGVGLAEADDRRASAATGPE